MTAKNSRSAYAADHFGGTSSTVTIKCYDSGRQPVEYKFTEWFLRSLPAVLSTYTESDNSLHPDSSLDKAYELLMSAFSLPNSYIFRRVNNDVSQAYSRSDKSKLRYPRFITAYLQNCQRIGHDSLCKKMMEITCGKRSISFVSSEDYFGLRASFERHHGELVKMACLLVKLKKCINEQCQRCTSTSELNVNPPASDPVEASIAPKTREQRVPTPSTRCDKTVQCSKGTEFLKVSPELKFFSRSSLVINRTESEKTRPQQPQQRRLRENQSTRGFDLLASPSLEYVANYRPEFEHRAEGGRPNLRSFSSSAIFGLQSGGSRARTVPARCANEYADKNYNSFTHKSRARKRDRRTERIRELLQRTETEMLRYSSFIEDDLLSLRSVEGPDGKTRCVAPDDVRTVKKILLDDYITEVKEIVRSESCRFEQEREVRILEELKQRMDEDLTTPPAEPAPSLRSDGSLGSRAPTCPSQTSFCSCSRSSYDTARECCCYYRCCCRRCPTRCCESPEEKPKSRRGGACVRDTVRSALHRVHGLAVSSAGLSKNCPTCVENIARRCDWLKEDLWAMSGKARSSHSLDSGVLADCPRHSDDWTSSDDNSERHAESREERGSSFSGTSCTDEVLCQRVESAVRKFTEELILCERRARDRSRSNRKRRDKWRLQAAPRDQSVFIYPRNSHCSSEDELITGISTPSLVSLSDSEIPTSIQT